MFQEDTRKFQVPHSSLVKVTGLVESWPSSLRWFYKHCFLKLYPLERESPKSRLLVSFLAVCSQSRRRTPLRKLSPDLNSEYSHS